MLPEKIRIAGIDYFVIEQDEIDSNPNVLGQCLYQRAQIQIKKGMSDDKKEQILIHEVLHGCFNEAGYEEQDEDMINRVSIVLYQVLKGNKLTFEQEVKENEVPQKASSG
ncbi:ImmA/IrrE family metallo-endopeptidase [Bacillaceae bacterium Marseille-Q3522]|nr:ImmA/IrrE family metallo-endopeptidase [Bacillaceae bacterium Marseille-Q3522]